MTTTTDSAGHPEVAEISDLTEGLLSPSRTGDVRRHLDGCELCADVYASLEEIRGMLGTLPGPPRMPADVAGRIDAALAAEALLDSTSPDAPFASAAASESASTSASAEPVTVPAAASASPAAARVSRETSPASTSGASVDRPAGHPRASTGPGRGERLRGTRRRTTVLGAVFTAAAIGLGSLLVYSLSDDSGGSGRQDSASSFADEKLKSKVADLLARTSVKSPGKSPGKTDGSFDTRSSPVSPETEPSIRTATVDVPVCIQRGIGDSTPIAAEEGTYEGKKAYLVVVPDASDSTQVYAYVVDAACVGKPSPAKGKVLTKHSYPQS
ncbi:anti-sigma factor family protein [Streptomyces sp. NPDC059002]|uniref:anti-sigma factor family protein n=1 Tax=Streptomyces sp. NPDC059002 TaxID=3346690 RepID=UPI0036A93B4B